MDGRNSCSKGSGNRTIATGFPFVPPRHQLIQAVIQVSRYNGGRKSMFYECLTSDWQHFCHILILSAERVQTAYIGSLHLKRNVHVRFVGSDIVSPPGEILSRATSINDLSTSKPFPDPPRGPSFSDTTILHLTCTYPHVFIRSDCLKLHGSYTQRYLHIALQKLDCYFFFFEAFAWFQLAWSKEKKIKGLDF